MNWSHLRGHAAQRDMLRRSLQRGRMAHAYLFAGPAGIGKSLFARLFVQSLLCERYSAELDICGECSACRQMEAGSHPDVFRVACPEGKAEIPVEVFYGAKEERGRSGLIHDLSLRPMAGERRVAIIDDANRMNEEGANAMLKTLEEPPAHSVLILIAENLDGILPTIRSRCQLIRFGTLLEQDVAELLLAHEIASSPEEARAAAAISEGSLQVASQLLDPALRELRGSIEKNLASADMNSVTAAKSLQEGIEGISTETSRQRVIVNWLIRFAQQFYRAALIGVAQPASLGSNCTLELRSFCERHRKRGLVGTELIIELLERAVEAEGHIAGNVSPFRTLEYLFDDLGRISRSRR